MIAVSLDEITRDIEALEPMNKSVRLLVQVANDSEASVDDIVDAVQFDPVMCEEILSAANSALAGASQEITTIKLAVVRMGMAWTLGLATGKYVYKEMTGEHKAYGLADHELWSHSLAAAIAAGRLGQHATQRVPSGAFTAALMHDVGKSVLARHLTEDAAKQIIEMADDGMSYIQAEKEVLGIDHAIVGGMIARHWQFPDDFAGAIENHHNPDADPSQMLDAVHVANVIAKMLGIGLGSEQMNMYASADSAKRLGLVTGSMEALCATTFAELTATECIFR